ncbi:MAG: DNA repair protein RecN [Candidatus Theseobacter exili]|nr:DNA repair protein RecN [Candidatus Theseobacter exili]
MLLRLRIKNIGIAEDILINFSEGLNVLTGETGAGKSLTIGAVKLVLGEKAGVEMIREGAEKGIVEAEFQVSKDNHVLDLLEKSGINISDESIVIKREIVAEKGRGICTINGAMVTISFLRKVGDFLVDLHGQHDHQALLKEVNHIDFLDTYGDLDDLRMEMEDAWNVFIEIDKKLKQLDDNNESNRREYELLTFQVHEIEQVNPQKGEDELLQQEHVMLSNAHRIQEVASNEFYELCEKKDSASDKVVRAIRQIDSLGDFSEQINQIVSELQEARCKIEDSGNMIRKIADQVEADPVRLEQVEDRIDELDKISRKYGGSFQSILNFYDEAKIRLKEYIDGDENREILENKRNKALDKSKKIAERLTEKRIKAASILKNMMEKEFMDLGLQKARFDVSINSDRLSLNGKDLVSFLFSANPGEGVKPLSDVASGGEISRIMLALKSLFGKKDNIPVMIFDEIDTNLGGQTASVVGEKLLRLMDFHQLIVITHLSQIACRASSHFMVSKEIYSGRTKTFVKNISDEDRVNELVRMLGGDKTSDEALEHARSLLLNKNNKVKQGFLNIH